MGLKERISAAVSAFRTGDFRNPFAVMPQPPILTASTGGQWEGYERNRLRQRPAARLVAQDTDLDYGNREKMIGEARALCQVFPIARALVRKFPLYCVGSCRVKWNTGDPEIDRLYEANWQQRMRMMDAGGNRHFRALARLVVKSRRRDGDVFGQKVLSDIGGEIYPQIKLIEADRINNGSLYAPDTKEMVGGVRITPAGRVVSYNVTDRTQYGDFENPQPIQWNRMLHIFDSDRVEAQRGVTEFDVVLNEIRDLKESRDAMRAKFKLNSKLTLLIKTVLGGSDRDFSGENDSLDTTKQSPNVKTQEINDGTIAHMFPGEDMKAHDPQIPGDAWLNFVEHLVRMIARGHDLPVGFVWAMDGTGPAVRFDMNSADRVFKQEFEILEEKFMRPACGWATSVDIEQGRIPFHVGWDNYRFQGPVGSTIDVGRDTNAGIKENEAGLGSRRDWFDEGGMDEAEEGLQIADENARAVRNALDAAERYKIPPEFISLALPAPKGSNTLQPEPPAQEDEPQKPAQKPKAA